MNLPKWTSVRQNTCVIYDLETKDPGSVYLSVTTRYEIGFGDQTLAPETQNSYAEARNWFESYDWSSQLDSLVVITAVILGAGLVALIFTGGLSALASFLLGVIGFFA